MTPLPAFADDFKFIADLIASKDIQAVVNVTHQLPDVRYLLPPRHTSVTFEQCFYYMGAKIWNASVIKIN